MAERLTRENLHALVWSQPMSKLAKRFGVSDVAIAKACAKICVPVPPRGYWARKAANKSVVTVALPPRPLGLEDDIEIPGNRYGYYRNRFSEEALSEPTPPSPTFGDSITDVRTRVVSIVSPVNVPRLADKCHPVVSRMLAADEIRRSEVIAKPHLASSNAPLFDDPIGRRRLRLLSAMLSASSLYGGRADLNNSDPGRVRIAVGHQSVFVGVKVHETRKRVGRGSETKVNVDRRLAIELNPGHDGQSADRSWEDGEVALEKRLREITIEILVSAEAQYRDGVVREHDYLVTRKAQIEEETQRRQIEADEKERARLAELERNRVDRLLGEAAALENARAIRRYVSEVVTGNSTSASPVSDEDLKKWCNWALTRADLIDPILNGDFKRPIGV